MVLGLVLFVGFCIMAVIALARKYFRHYFNFIHRSFAALLLVVAAAHFWAFAILLIPVSSLHGVAAALSTSQNFRSWCQSDPKMPHFHVATAVALSFAANILAFLLVWWGRAMYMVRDDATLYVPFVFPACSLFGGFMSGFGVALITFSVIQAKK
jgi:hypothetical protein